MTLWHRPLRTSTGSSLEGNTLFDWRHKFPWSIAHRHSLFRLISQPAFAVFKLMDWLCVGWYCVLCRYFARGSCFSPVSNVMLNHGSRQSWYWDHENVVRRRLSWQEADSFTEGKITLESQVVTVTALRQSVSARQCAAMQCSWQGHYCFWVCNSLETIKYYWDFCRSEMASRHIPGDKVVIFSCVCVRLCDKSDCVSVLLCFCFLAVVKHRYMDHLLLMWTGVQHNTWCWTILLTGFCLFVCLSL